ncbi:MAG: VWA domain-containing protein [Candidatus Hydrogenedentes bacterium]|nr:VWA domain-containing protein [Candidatus Hydrogenedentota bacterium]
MHINKLRLGWTAALAALVATALSFSATAEQVRLGAAMGQPTILVGDAQKGYLRISLTGMKLPKESRRTPVNLAIVLDKSGSMTGEKIANAKAAAIKAVSMLQPDDIVSIVAYDDTVKVLVPATKVADRDYIFAGIERIQAGGNTALFAGVSKGAAEVRKFHSRNRVNRVILLSDGLANVGPSSPGDLAELGTSLIREGISVTTIGLGLDYNEDLMTKLAQKSDGNHMFAEKASDLEWIFARELGDVLSVVAQDIEITIECHGGIRPIRILGRDAEIVGQRVTTIMNQLYSDQVKYVFLEVELPATFDRIKLVDAQSGTGGPELQVADVRVRFNNTLTQREVTDSAPVFVELTNSPETVEKRTNAAVMASVIEQIGVERNIAAVQLRDEGKVEEARQALVSNTVFLIENAEKYDSEALREYGVKNKLAEENLDDDSWRHQRKVMKEEQHAITNQQRATGKP